MFNVYVDLLNKECGTSYHADDFGSSVTKLATQVHKDGYISQEELDMIVAQDKLAKQTLYKNANIFSKVKALPGNIKRNMGGGDDSPNNKMLMTMLAANFGLGLLGNAPHLVRGIKQEIQDATTDNYSQMLAKHPHLVETDDQEQRDQFGVLEQFNPDIARNPYLAGKFIGEVRENSGYIGTDEIAKLVSIQKNVPGRGLGESAKDIQKTLAPVMLFAGGVSADDPETSAGLVDSAIAASDLDSKKIQNMMQG